MKEIALKSGSVLKIGHIPFAEAKNLYQAVLEEAKSIKLSASTDITAMMKDLFCVGFSSKRVELALNEVMKRCLYNDLKIDDKTFEPLEARCDYSIVCVEVLMDVLAPFTKGLYAEFGRLLAMIENVQS